MKHDTPYADKLKNINQQISKLSDSQSKSLHGFSSLRKAAATSGELSQKVKELIALSIAVADQCDGCIAFHVDDAMRVGANRAEIEEALMVAVSMGGGPALVYATHALDAYDELADKSDSEPLPRYFD
ncbi:MAG: AhpD family alkylhydroperoxidase [Limisphaerales bacterium]|jgi:AhpD family alkylhydroperoxidase